MHYVASCDLYFKALSTTTAPRTGVELFGLATANSIGLLCFNGGSFLVVEPKDYLCRELRLQKRFGRIRLILCPAESDEDSYVSIRLSISVEVDSLILFL